MKKSINAALGFVMAVFLITACTGNTAQQTDIKTDLPRVAVLLTEGFHDGEAYMLMGYLANKDFDITVIGPETGRVKAYNSDFEIVIEKAVSEVDIKDFDGLIIPGGMAPAALKESSDAVSFARDFFNTGKMVASVCHGPQVLAAAGVLEGFSTTAVSSIKEEVEAAGASYVDEQLHIDRNLITSRVPRDLPYLAKAIEDALKNSRQ